MKIKTKYLAGAALDWAVGIATGLKFDHAECFPEYWVDGKMHPTTEPGRHSIEPYSPSTDWAQGGPLIDKFKPHFKNKLFDGVVEALWKDAGASGETYLIAICRAIVVGKIGDEIEVPDELVGGAA